jgi:subtilisin family serine protease
VFGQPASRLLAAQPANTIPWDSVGPDWLAFAYPRRVYADPVTFDQRGLYLVDPDDRIYAVSALPSDGTDLLAVSWTGRRALLQGPCADGLPIGVLDLETTGFRTVVPVSGHLDAYSFTRDGAGLWLYDVPSSDQLEPGGSVRLSRIEIADLTRTSVFEEAVSRDDLGDYFHWWVNNRGGAIELADGDVVVATPTGVWTGLDDGDAFRKLDTPYRACSVVDAWDDATVQVRCRLPETPAWCDCGPSGLWLVPIDGGPSTPLAIPEQGLCTSYSRATPLDGKLAVSAGFDSGECSSGVVIVDGDRAELWVPPDEDVRCMEHVVGIRNGAWVISAANPYAERSPIALFEVSSAGASRVDVPDTWVLALSP